MTGPLRALALALSVVLLWAGVVAARMLAEGAAELRESDRAFHRGDLPRATLHARRAAVAWLPGAPHVARAHARLANLATGCEARGRPDCALEAWRALRGAVLAVRHLGAPHAAALAAAEQGIARLEAQPPDADGTTPAPTRGPALPPRAPSPWPSAALLLGTISVVLGLTALVEQLRGAGSPRLARAAVLACAVGLGFWALSAVLA